MDQNTNSKKILIVEDDAIILKALNEALVEDGFEVLEAGDGQVGLATALEKHPDLILLDIVMPIMDGWTMFQKLREDAAWGKQVPVIILTNLSSDDDRQMNLITKFEPAYYLVKSNWKVDDVVQKVRSRLLM
jgi:DNA-binding response OmpR family regulator